jgi:hypothetical protein
MPLPETEVTVALVDLLTSEWGSTSIAVDETFKPAWISTGWWNEETPNPQITLTNVSEPTDPDGLAAGGGLAAWVDGTLDCNVWVPYARESYASQGVAKDFRWQLTRRVHAIVEANQTGTGALTRLETGAIRRNPGEEPPPFRMLIEISFQYRTAP